MSTWKGTRWQYKSVNLDEFAMTEVAVQVMFSELGDQGWELVTIIYADRHSTAFFRRPLPPAEQPKFNDDKA